MISPEKTHIGQSLHGTIDAISTEDAGIITTKCGMAAESAAAVTSPLQVVDNKKPACKQCHTPCQTERGNTSNVSKYHPYLFTEFVVSYS